MKASSKRLLLAALALSLAACAAPKRREPLPDRPVDQTPAAPTQAAAPAAPVKDPQTRFDEALAAYKAKDFKLAREGFAALAKEHPELSGPLTNLGILDAKANNRPAAIAQFARAVAVNPDNAIAYNWLGILYREARDYPRAEQAYLRSLTLKPNEPAVVLNLGILYDVYLKRPAQALERYREYQQLTGSKELKVTAWIKALEATQVPVSAEVKS